MRLKDALGETMLMRLPIPIGLALLFVWPKIALFLPSLISPSLISPEFLR